MDFPYFDIFRNEYFRNQVQKYKQKENRQNFHPGFLNKIITKKFNQNYTEMQPRIYCFM